MNKYEKEQTQCFDGIYTSEEIQLNKKLYDECTEKHVDLEAVEALLKQGADPLGATEEAGWGLLDHVYGEIICICPDDSASNLPKITELFLKYGMDIDRPRISYDVEDSINPMWSLAFITNQNSATALKMLLDKGISADSVGSFWGHAMTDMLNVFCGDPNDEFWDNECTWTLKMMMLAASYDHILENDEALRDFIGCSYNDYDIHKFREWDNFYYEYDTSRCEPHPELYRSVVKIYEAKSHKQVWKVGIGLSQEEF